MAIDLESQPMERWLDCQLEKGMFSDEIAVTYPSVENLKTSVFVPRTAVRGEAGSRGQVLVRIFRRGDKIFAILPTPYQESVEVVEGDLSQ